MISTTLHPAGVIPSIDSSTYTTYRISGSPTRHSCLTTSIIVEKNKGNNDKYGVSDTHFHTLFSSVNRAQKEFEASWRSGGGRTDASLRKSNSEDNVSRDNI